MDENEDADNERDVHWSIEEIYGDGQGCLYRDNDADMREKG